MKRAGAVTHESVQLAGHSRAHVIAAVVAAMTDDPEYKSAQHGSDAFQFVRVYRPTWAIVAGVALFPVFGLGLLFFFVHKSESCTISVVDGPRGAVLTVVGRLLPGRVERITECTQHRPYPTHIAAPHTAELAVVHAAPTRHDVDGELDREFASVAAQCTDLDTTIARPKLRAAPVARDVVQRTHVLRMDDGRLVPLTSTVLIGRGPKTSGEDRDAQLVAVSDRGVSKSHLRVALDEHGVWLEDLHSTNGTSVAHPDGSRVTLRGGEPTRVESGAVVFFGDSRAEVALDE